MKKLRRLFSVLLAATFILSSIPRVYAADSVNVTRKGGWFEYAFVMWDKVTGSSDYNVYYKKSSESSFKQLTGDDKKYLIYDNGTNMQVDIPGLAGNTDYDIKIVPVINGSDDESKGKTVTVKTLESERVGYAFKDDATWVTGGYNKDGSTPDGVTIFYLTSSTKDELNSIAGSNNPKIIRVIGDVEVSNISVGANTTVEGIRNTAKFTNETVAIGKSAPNVEIKNMIFGEGHKGDGVTVSGGKRVFVHNNTFESGEDGACDIARVSDFVTFSYNHLDQAKKSILIGAKDGDSGDQGHQTVTIHHNWFDNAVERCPRVRWGNVHVFNNFYDSVKLYGVGSACEGQVLVENNYYSDTQRPYIVSQQGNAILPLNADGSLDLDYFNNYFRLYNTDASKSEFSSRPNIMTSSPAGYLKAVGNVLENCSYHDPIADINESGFNFDPSTVYTYSAETPEVAKEKAKLYSGIINYDSPLFDEGGVEITTQATTEATTQNPDVLVGDVNKDGSITASDAANVLAYVLNSDAFDFTKEVADVDNNGQITASDAASILAKVLNADFVF